MQACDGWKYGYLLFLNTGCKKIMLSKKKILLFTDWYEPGFKAGGPIQSTRNIVNRFGNDIDFYIFTSDRDLGDHKPYEDIETNRWITLPNDAKIWYASPNATSSSILRKIIGEVRPDMVYLNSMYSPRFSLLPLWILKGMGFRGRVILAPRGMLKSSAVSKKKWKKKIFLFLFSLTRMHGKLFFHATDEQELRDIQQYFGRISNSILAENLPARYNVWHERDKQKGHLKCICISRIHPIKNLLYALRALQQAEACDIEFDVYGSIEDKEYFNACKTAANQLQDNVTVNFKGPLPHISLFDTLQSYHLFFLPTQGENFGHVIYEALSGGLPVLISDKTPWKNLEEHNAGWAIPLADLRSFTARLRDVCAMDKNTFNQKSIAAHQYAQAYFDKIDHAKKYSALFGTPL
jgi:glycosyltransferase involved in cell wall biosynthesis